MADRSGIVNKYTDTQTKFYMSLAEAEALSIELAERLRQKISPQPSDSYIVVGIANGGLMVAKIVAETLDSSFEIIGIRRSGTGLKRKIGKYDWIVCVAESLLQIRILIPVWRRLINKMKKLEMDAPAEVSTESEQSHTSFKGKHVILVDDCIESGQTIRQAKKSLLEAGAKAVTTGVLTLKKLKDDRFHSEQFEPIVYLNTRIQHYPWSHNNKEYQNFLDWLNGRGIKPWL
jgi:phosphoribosylpyrophosphate synthetase